MSRQVREETMIDENVIQTRRVLRLSRTREISRSEERLLVEVSSRQTHTRKDDTPFEFGVREDPNDDTHRRKTPKGDPGSKNPKRRILNV